jgi:DNA polymerase-3 subunit delta
MPGTVHLIHGGDDYFVEQQARALVDRLVPPADRTFGLETIDGRAGTQDEAVAALRQCVEAVRTPGFFGSGKLVWLRNANFLNPLVRPGDGAAVKEVLAGLTACVRDGLPDGQRLLVTAESVPGNSAFLKACTAAGEVAEHAVGDKPWQRRKEAEGRLEELLEAAGVRMESDARARLLDRAGTRTRVLVQELEKLALYLGPQAKPAAVADVDAVVSAGAEAEATALSDAIGDRDPTAIAATLRQLETQDESPIRLVTLAESRVRDLLVLRVAIDRGWLQARPGGRGASCRWNDPLPAEAEAVLAALPRDPRKTSSYMLSRAAGQALNYRLNDLRRLRHALIGVREQLVSSSLPGGLLLQLALLRHCRRPAAPAR